MDLWPHQAKGVADVLAALQSGERRLLLTSPTGGGKSRMVCEIIDRIVDDGWYAVLYTNRRMLIDQLVEVLDNHGIDFGIRAAGHDDDDAWHRVQISSLPTERSRVLKSGTWRIHGEGQKCLAIVDEAHLNDGDTAQQLFGLHDNAGHARLGVSATPIGLGASYDKLIVAGTNSELRKCGALVQCICYGPDEPDLRMLRGKKAPTAGDEFTEKQQAKLMGMDSDSGRVHLIGRVWEWFEKINPEHKATILFAPSVQGSLWFAEQFTKKGVPAAHIDGQEVWVDGKLYRTSKTIREEVLGRSKDGRVAVLCNRFVLREGIDAPWLCHGVFATCYGSLQSYLQSGGRLLRAFPGIERVTLQDHGGNWWRHGSLNADRVWHLDYTARIYTGLREDRLRAKKEAEPARCPKCAMILLPKLGFYKCLCGWEAKIGRQSRPVVTTDGSLKELGGDIFRPKRIYQQPNGPALWERMYWRARSKKWNASFKQAMAMFATENNWGWPDPSWPFMPVYEIDYYRLCSEVEMDRLVPKRAS